jgi:hypothetical protein
VENFSFFKNLFEGGAMILCEACFPYDGADLVYTGGIIQPCEQCHYIGPWPTHNYVGDPRKAVQAQYSDVKPPEHTRPPHEILISFWREKLSKPIALCTKCHPNPEFLNRGLCALQCSQCGCFYDVVSYQSDPRIQGFQVDGVPPATQHPAIPLACLELPDAASFMKGGPIQQKNFDPFGVSGST